MSPKVMSAQCPISMSPSQTLSLGEDLIHFSPNHGSAPPPYKTIPPFFLFLCFFPPGSSTPAPPVHLLLIHWKILDLAQGFSKHNPPFFLWPSTSDVPVPFGLSFLSWPCLGSPVTGVSRNFFFSQESWRRTFLLPPRLLFRMLNALGTCPYSVPAVGSFLG